MNLICKQCYINLDNGQKQLIEINDKMTKDDLKGQDK